MASPSTNIKITATDKTGTAFKAVNKNVSGMQKGVTALKSAFVGLAGAMGARAFIRFANQQLKAADTIGKMASKLQISTTALQTFRFAGEQSGETLETMDNNLIKFAKQLGEAQVGIGLAKRELEILGIELRNQSGDFKSHEEVLNEVADAFMNMRDPARKMSSAMALFGRSGHVMVNMLSDGADGLERLRDQLVKTGGIIDEKFIREAEDANDAMNRLSKTFGAITTRLMSDLSPAILKVTDNIMELMDIDANYGRGVDRLKRDLEKVNEEISEWQQKAFAMQKTISESNVVMNTLNARHAELAGIQGEIADRVQRRANIEEHLANIPKKVLSSQKKVTETLEEQNNILTGQALIQKNASAHALMANTKLMGILNQRNKEEKEFLELLEDEYSDEFAEMQRKQTEEIALQNEKIAEQKRLQEEASAAKLKAQEELRSQHKERMEQLKREKEAEERLRREGLKQTISVAKATGDILYEQGVMGFDAMRALAFTEAIINAQLAATKALATLPPPWSYAAATASYAYAAARAYEIKNMKPPAREMGGTVTKGKPFMVGEKGAEIFTPGQTGSITPNNKMGGANITFNILANDAQGFDQLLLARRGLIVSMINKAMHQQGKRALI